MKIKILTGTILIVFIIANIVPSIGGVQVNENERLKIISRITRFFGCYPWIKIPVDIQNPLLF